MSDEHHARFGDWMASGALGEPTRDAALHASVCDGCLGLVAALDALAAIDTGRAALPPSRLGQRKRAMPMLRVARLGLATAAVAMLGAAVAFGASQLIAGRRLPAARQPAPTIAGGVLGAVGGPSASEPSPSPRSTATQTAKATLSASPPRLTPSAGEAPRRCHPRRSARSRPPHRRPTRARLPSSRANEGTNSRSDAEPKPDGVTHALAEPNPRVTHALADAAT